MGHKFVYSSTDLSVHFNVNCMQATINTDNMNLRWRYALHSMYNWTVEFSFFFFFFHKKQIISTRLLYQSSIKLLI